MNPFLAFILSMAITIALIPVLMRLAGRMKVLDQPGARKVHGTAIPRVGGIAMVIGTYVPLLMSMDVNRQTGAYLVAAAVIFLFGVWDDRRQLSPVAKILGQLVAVFIVIYAGDIRISHITLMERIPLPEFLSLPLTVFFLLGATNAINLADGLDGLAGGTTMLCCAAIFLLAWAVGLNEVATIALVLCGSILGFLRFNTHPARVFMGDGGSQFLGFSVAVLSITLTQSSGVVYATALPVLLLGLPIVDTLTVMLQRLREGRSPFIADQKHLHHKLLGLGFDHHEAVVIIYAVQALFFLAAWFTRFASDTLVLGIFALLAGGVVTAMMVAGRMGWRWRGVTPHAAAQNAWSTSRLARAIGWLSSPDRLPRWMLIAASACVIGYLLSVAGLAKPPDAQIRWFALALGAVALVGTIMERLIPDFEWLMRATLYMAVTLAVYLDFLTPATSGPLLFAKWMFLPLLVIAVGMSMRLSPERRFTITTLDVLLIFIVITLPNLPGLSSSPAHLGISLGKLVALVYGIELCASRSRKAPPALAAGVVLFSAVILLRSALG